MHFHDEVKHDPKTGQFTSGGGGSGSASASKPSGSGTRTPKRHSASLYSVDLPGGKKGEMRRGRQGWETRVYGSNGKVAHLLSEGMPSMKAAHARFFENYNEKEMEKYGPNGRKNVNYDVPSKSKAGKALEAEWSRTGGPHRSGPSGR